MSHRLTKHELDEQFELFLKESVSDDSDKQSGAKSSQKSAQKTSQKAAVPWWQEDEHSSDGTGREVAQSRFIKAKRSQHENDNGLLASGKTFRKSLRRSAGQEDEDPGEAGLREVGLKAAPSGGDEPVMAPAANATAIGLDTIEEEEEKARFFAQLEAGALSAIDYSILNRELDSTSPTITTTLRRAEEAVEQSDDDEGKARVPEAAKESPGSPNYSEDFEEEENGKELSEKKHKLSPILAKVSLHDSLDASGGAERGQDAAGSLDKGQAYVQSGASDLEALHEAYRQIHVVGDPDDHRSPVEGSGRVIRPVSPSSPPHHATRSLQPASTNESELPTVEELMRPIRPEREHLRGFTLQPVSAGGPEDQGKTPRILDRTFPEPTPPDSHRQRAERSDPAERMQAAGGSNCSPPDPSNLTWSIRQEVEKLMQDQNKSSSKPSQAGRAKKQQASYGAAVSLSSTSSVRKPTGAPVRGRRVEGRTAGPSRASGPSPAAASARSQPSASRPLQHPGEKDRVTKSQDKEDSTEPGLKVSSELVASVQSLVAVLQQQIDTSSHQDATDAQEVPKPTHRLPNNREEDGSLVEELRGQLAHKESELQVMKGGAEELNSLRQQNYLLHSKLRSAEEASQKQRWPEATDSAAEGKLQQIDKEMKEQETLIKGYQQENEKLYLQMKAQQVKSKANEDAMFSENQRLLSELAFTREQLNKTSRTVGSVCLMDHTQRIADLLAQLNTFQRNEAKLSEDVHTLKQEQQALQVELQLMKKERDLAKAQAASASAGDKTFEMRVLEDEHREEVAALKKKLQWFAENQELLDRDAGRLNAATAEIHQLQEQVERLKLEVGKRGSEQQRKSKEKTMDTKRMRDLERQVKELEQILRGRNPNSLPALIYAAAAAGCQEEAAAKTPPAPGRVNALLERRIQRLEAELEGHDEEAKRGLRAMEQMFHRIKLRYEQQISELEQKLEQHQQQQQQQQVEVEVVGSEPRRSQSGPLEEELRRVEKSHQERETCLQDQIESLQQQLKHTAQPSPDRHRRQAEAAFGARIERLNNDLASKTRTIQELCRTVERLQKERRNMMFVPNPRTETRPAETKRQPAKTLRSAAAGGEETFPAAHCEKTYQPTVFTGSHISEVMQENEALKELVERLQRHSKQEMEALSSDALRAKEELCRLEARSAERLSSVRAEHLRVLDQLRAAHALEHASSKVADLANKLNTQEITVKHLREQLKEVQGAKEALAISRTREDALQKQLTRLLTDLKEAKDAQSPEVKLLCGLERKIITMELRHQHREQELQQVIGGSWQTSDADQQSELQSWKRLAEDKSRELEAFRLELDSILDILRHLQRQGVVLSRS
ncbi:centrosomal protein of 162 kDa isoform X2 [Clinocottus analis]|uniref:centrosomal protein of 162 kDa isoform X2 n=1 Tax=Clinocottus analis TaxID=304258 RepID=UPI0035C1EA6C